MKFAFFATLKEAHASLKAVKAAKLSETLYEFEEGKIVITGMGMPAAQSAVSHFAKEAKEIYNFGFAGALKDLPLGGIYRISLSGKYLFLPKKIDSISEAFAKKNHPPLALGEGLKLLSSDFPLHEKKTKAVLSKEWDLIDMEGYGIAYAACYHGLPCHIWKVISDFASEKGHSIIKKNSTSLSEKIAETFLCLLKKK